MMGKTILLIEDNTFDAKVFSVRKEGIGGLTGRAQSGHQANDFFLTHHGPTGGALIDDNYRPIVNNPDAVKTVEMLAEFVKIGLVGMTAYGYGEMVNSFVQGDAAFLFIQWMTNKATDVKLAEMGGDPIRTSTMNNPELQAKFEDYPVLVEQLECARADWRPLIPEYPEIDAQIIGTSASEAITGVKPAQQAMDEANAKIEALLEEKGYYAWQ